MTQRVVFAVLVGFVVAPMPVRAQAAHAIDGVPAAVEALADAEATAAEPVPLVSGNVWYLDATLGEYPYLGVGIALDGGVAISIGASFTYDGNGIGEPDPVTMAPPADKVALGVYGYVQYMVVNDASFAMGPSITYEALVAPAPVAGTSIVLPAWQFYYLPWPTVPVTLGVQWGARCTFEHQRKPVVTLTTPALVLSYVFS